MADAETIPSSDAGAPEEAPHRFHRSLTGFGVIILALSVLSPGVSVFVAGGAIVNQAGTGAVIAFLIGGIVCYFQTALSAELGAAYPTAGYDYAAIGHGLGDWAGATNYLTALLFSPLFLNVSAAGIATYLQPFGIGIDPVALTMLTVAVVTGLALLNIRANEYLTGFFMLIELAVLMLVAAVGAWHVRPDAAALLVQPVRMSDGVLVAAGIGVIGIAINSASWALAGASQALMFSEDMKRPETIGRIIMITFALTIAMEIAPVIGSIIGAHDLHAVLASSAPFETFLAQHLPAMMLKFASLAVAVAIFNACLAGFVGNGRVVFSMGRSALFPAPVNRALMRVIPATDAPWVALVFMGVMTALASLIPMSVKILILSGNYLIITGFYAAGVYAGRRSGRTGRTYRTPLFPLFPVLGGLIVAGEVVVLWLDPDTGRKSLLIAVGMNALSYLYYRFVLMRRPGGWRMTGPADIDAIALAATDDRPGRPA